MQSSPNHLIVVTGFGAKGVPEFEDSLRQAKPNIDIRTLEGCPPEKADVHPHDLIESLAADLATAPERFSLLGHSYGALLALGAACRLRLRNMENVVLVDGPLAPDIEVRPPQNGLFDRFNVQYQHRVDTAQRCMAVLREMPWEERQRIVTIGSARDLVVSPFSKSLPGIIHNIFKNPASDGHSLNRPKIAELTRFLVSEVMRQPDPARESRVSQPY